MDVRYRDRERLRQLINNNLTLNCAVAVGFSQKQNTEWIKLNNQTFLFRNHGQIDCCDRTVLKLVRMNIKWVR